MKLRVLLKSYTDATNVFSYLRGLGREPSHPVVDGKGRYFIDIDNTNKVQKEKTGYLFKFLLDEKIPHLVESDKGTEQSKYGWTDT